MIVVPVCELVLSHIWLILTVDDWVATTIIGQDFESANFGGFLVILIVFLLSLIW